MRPLPFLGQAGYAWARVPARVQAAARRRQHRVVSATGRERVGARAAPLQDSRGQQLRPRRRRGRHRAASQAGRQHPAPLLARGDRRRRQRRSAAGLCMALRRGLRAPEQLAALELTLPKVSRWQGPDPISAFRIDDLVTFKPTFVVSRSFRSALAAAVPHLSMDRRPGSRATLASEGPSPSLLDATNRKALTANAVESKLRLNLE
jgi:hypothetical protein